MRRLLPFSLLSLGVAGLLAVRVAVAEDPKTYTFPAHETWKAGDVVTRTSSDHDVQKQTVKTPDGNVVKNETTDKLTEFTGVMKVLDVDGDGRYTKAHIYFSKWSMRKGEAEDKSLEGKHVEVTGVGASRTTKVLTTGSDVSPDAASWLDEHLGKGSAKHEDSGEIFNPKQPVAVGETWSPEVSKLEKMFGDKMTFLADKSTATITLVGVEDDVASIGIDLALQAGPMETPQGKMEWKEGGMFTMKAEGKKPLKAGVHAEDGKMSGSFKGVIAAGPATVELDMSMEQTSHVEAGGEMPPLPAAK